MYFLQEYKEVFLLYTNMPSKKTQQKPNITISIGPSVQTSQNDTNEPDAGRRSMDADGPPTSGSNLESSQKRGRKPKGGKIISKKQESNDIEAPIANIILHLKCSMSDLNTYNTKMTRMLTNELVYNPDVPPEIHTYNTDKIIEHFSIYNDNVENTTQHLQESAYSDHSILFSNTNTQQSAQNNICNACKCQLETTDEDSSVHMKDINQKLKHLKINLYKNTLQDKKSACFWCSYEYDNQPCYIPKYEMDDKIYGYGSFCRPECAVAYLMKESLDDSTKFERYHLLNHIYSKVYDYKNNIKPAPNPFFLLEKYYGNLSIQEYRKLLRTEHLLSVIDKPMSRILPELVEDNDNFVLNIYGNSSKPEQQHKNVYKVKRQSEKGASQSKNSIIKEKFGIA